MKSIILIIILLIIMMIIKNKNIEHMSMANDVQNTIFDTIKALFNEFFDIIFYLLASVFGKYMPLCWLDCKYTKYVYLDKICNCPTQESGKKCRQKWECNPCSSNNSKNVNGVDIGNCKGNNEGIIYGFCCNNPSNVGLKGDCREDGNCSSNLVCRGNLGGTANGKCDNKNALENTVDDVTSFIPSW